MFKKLCLALTFATVSFITAIDANQPETAPANTPKTKEDRIKAAKQSLALDMQTMLVVSRKALSAQKAALKDGFDAIYQRVLKVVHQIVNTPEFTQASEKMAELQKNHILFDTPLNEEDFNNPALINKVNELLAKEFISLDAQSEQLFNIMYVTIANIMANRQLMNKLDAEPNSFTTKTQ